MPQVWQARVHRGGSQGDGGRASLPLQSFSALSSGFFGSLVPPVLPLFCRPLSAVEETSAFRGGSGSPPAPEPLTFSEGSRPTGVGTQQNDNPIKDVVSLGRGRLPSPAPGRPRTHWLNAKQGAGLRARLGGSGRFRSRESGLGFHWESPGVVAAADPPRHCLRRARPARGWRAAPQSRGAKGGGAPTKWSGLRAGAGSGEVCALGAWIPEPWCLARSGQCTGRQADALEREVKLQPSQRRLLSYAGQPVPGEHSRAR